MAEQTTPGPWKFERQEMFLEHARLTGKVLADHEGYFRENDGTWAIGDSTGARVASATFKGTAKRGHGYESPDPEGMANARLIAAAPELLKALEAESSKERRDYPTIFGHKCRWCEECCEKVRHLRLAAIQSVKGDK